MPKTKHNSERRSRLFGPFDQSSDIGFWFNVNLNAKLSRVKEIEELTPDLLHRLDYSSTSEAELELICLDNTQAPGILQRIVTARVFRLKEPRCVLIRFQRRFALRAEMIDPKSYLPLNSYIKVLEDYYTTIGAETAGKSVIWTPGDHGVVLVWCIALAASDTTTFGDVLRVAQDNLNDIEEIYAARMVPVDATSPWQSIDKITQGRWLSNWEVEQFRASEEIQLLRQLGSGGVATTWVGKSVETGGDILVKILAPDLRFKDVDVLRERFCKEFEIGQRLNGCGCSPDFFSIANFLGRTYYTAKYYPWPTLNAWSERKRRSIKRRQDLSYSLIRCVGRMHDQGIIHRDISPRNLLIGPNEEVLLIDFGAATSTNSTERCNLDITLPGHQFGTLKYSAPELRDSAEEATQASDVFSIGIIIYEIFLQRNIAGSMPSLKDLGIPVSTELSEFAFKAIRFSLNERPRASPNFGITK